MAGWHPACNGSWARGTQAIQYKLSLIQLCNVHGLPCTSAQGRVYSAVSSWGQGLGHEPPCDPTGPNPPHSPPETCLLIGAALGTQYLGCLSWGLRAKPRTHTVPALRSSPVGCCQGSMGRKWDSYRIYPLQGWD